MKINSWARACAGALLSVLVTAHAQGKAVDFSADKSTLIDSASGMEWLKSGDMPSALAQGYVVANADQVRQLAFDAGLHQVGVTSTFEEFRAEATTESGVWSPIPPWAWGDAVPEASVLATYKTDYSLTLQFGMEQHSSAVISTPDGDRMVEFVKVPSVKIHADGLQKQGVSFDSASIDLPRWTTGFPPANQSYLFVRSAPVPEPASAPMMLLGLAGGLIMLRAASKRRG